VKFFLEGCPSGRRFILIAPLAARVRLPRSLRSRLQRLADFSRVRRPDGSAFADCCDCRRFAQWAFIPRPTARLIGEDWSHIHGSGCRSLLIAFGRLIRMHLSELKETRGLVPVFIIDCSFLEQRAVDAREHQIAVTVGVAFHAFDGVLAGKFLLFFSSSLICARLFNGLFRGVASQKQNAPATCRAWRGLRRFSSPPHLGITAVLYVDVRGSCDRMLRLGTPKGKMRW
jgi:hypothetical protein